MTFYEALNAEAIRYLRELLTEHQWNVTRAARAAGLRRTHLYRLMGRHGITRTLVAVPIYSRNVLTANGRSVR